MTRRPELVQTLASVLSLICVCRKGCRAQRGVSERSCSCDGGRGGTGGMGGGAQRTAAVWQDSPAQVLPLQGQVLQGLAPRGPHLREPRGFCVTHGTCPRGVASTAPADPLAGLPTVPHGGLADLLEAPAGVGSRWAGR